MLGKRTYFQDSRPQLALRVTDADSPSSALPVSPREERPSDRQKDSREDAREECPAEDVSAPPVCPRLPTDLRLGDDTRRERVQYDDPALETATSPLRQAVILTK